MLDREQAIHKALLLLDKDRDNEALVLLKDLYRQTSSSNDNIGSVQAATLLGDYYYQMSLFEDARQWLNEVSTLATIHPELEDIVGYEINLARELLKTIS